MHRKLIGYSNKIFNLFSIIASITDERLKPQIPTVKIVAAIIIMHFTNQGSLNSLSQEIAYKKLKADIPSVSTIARSADTMDLEEIIAQVHDRHRSSEFISLLKEMDAYYPAESTIRIILDNHSAHISKETMKYLAGRPGRFLYVYTPKHGSWLNLVETLFSKMARTSLKHIRVNSKQELKERILLSIKEINASPVVHRWKKFDFAHAF